jgi:hypothetical protein
MNSKNMAMALITVLVISILGGVAVGIAESEDGIMDHGSGFICDCDGDGQDPDGVPSGDPEHPH